MEIKHFVGNYNWDRTRYLFVHGVDKDGVLEIPWNVDTWPQAKRKETWTRLGIFRIL